MASGLIPGSTGILGDAGITLVQAMGPGQSLHQYLLPSVFALFAVVLVAIDKAKIPALISVLAASGMFAYMDWGVYCCETVVPGRSDQHGRRDTAAHRRAASVRGYAGCGRDDERRAQRTGRGGGGENL